jgi:hypothetical protein
MDYKVRKIAIFKFMKKMAVIMIPVTIFMMVIVSTIISGSITTKNINERQRSTLKKRKRIHK